MQVDFTYEDLRELIKTRAQRKGVRSQLKEFIGAWEGTRFRVRVEYVLDGKSRILEYENNMGSIGLANEKGQRNKTGSITVDLTHPFLCLDEIIKAYKLFPRRIFSLDAPGLQPGAELKKVPYSSENTYGNSVSKTGKKTKKLKPLRSEHNLSKTQQEQLARLKGALDHHYLNGLPNCGRLPVSLGIGCGPSGK